MNKLISSPDILRDIWYSGAPYTVSWEYIDELFIAIQKNVVTYDVVALCDAKLYLTNDEKFVVDGPGPQSNGHMLLKKLAQEWLVKTIQVDCQFESYKTGLHADVMSRDGSIIIECGTTDPACAFIYLDQHQIQWIGVVPYPYQEDQSIILHKFSRGSEYSSFRQKKNESLRNIFLNAKSKK